jgi:Hydantoinase/oxoprolinase
VRVAGVAGGSLIRARYRRGRLHIEEIGPRSAHIAGLPYCSFVAAEELERSEPKLISPRPGDPAAYVVLESPSGRRFAPTPTCAANALGEVSSGAYAAGDARAARIAFERLAPAFGVEWRVLATSVLTSAAGKVAAVVANAMEENHLGSSFVIGLGGGAGALIPATSRSLGLDHVIPKHAEVISSVGDALSLIRVEVERTLPSASTEALTSIYREAEQAAVEAGASPASLQVESEAVPHKNALRVVATGAVALDSHAGVPQATLDTVRAGDVARAKLGAGAELITHDDFYAVFATPAAKNRSFAVVDRFGTVAASGEGQVLVGPPNEIAAQIQESLPRYTRHYGPVGVAPALRVLRGSKLIDLSLVSSPDKALAAVLNECASCSDDSMTVFITRA